MKKVAVVVADIRELSPFVVSFLEHKNIPIFEIGIKCEKKDFIEALCKEFDELWNVGSVGSNLPLYSVFEVGYTCNKGNGYTTNTDSLWSVETVDDFLEKAPSQESIYSCDMELYHLCTSALAHNVSVYSIKYVSDNFGTVQKSDWYRYISFVANVVEKPLIYSLKKFITRWQNEE